MLTKTLRKLLVTIAIGTNSVTCSNPVLTVAADDPVAAAQQEKSATASLPSVTILDVEADIFGKVDAVEQTDAPLNGSLDGVKIEQPCVAIRVGASESGTSDTIDEGQLKDVQLSPSSLACPL